VLLYLEWLKKNKNHQIDVVSLRTVEGLLERFKAVSNHFYDASKLSKSPTYSFIDRIKHHLLGVNFISEYDVFLNNLISNQYDLVFANTIIAIPLALEIKNTSKHSKLAVYIHELETVIREFNPNIENELIEFDCIIAASNLVKTNLVENFNLAPETISVVYETTEVSLQVQSSEIKREKAPFNVVMVGGAYWRKGDDLFLLIASIVLKKLKLTTVHFYWIGSMSNERSRVNLADIKKLGITENVHLVGEVNDPSILLSDMDLFMLTSREDPFPLSVLEAGMMGLPILCFDQGTGIKEIINETNGRVVPYLDIQAMADAIAYYFSEKQFVRLDKARIMESFGTFTSEINSPKLDEILNKCLIK
jgi:glycosyltransferase involved in cell wall biosynthesis